MSDPAFPPPPTISVVIPTLNEEASLADAIRSASDADEIVVVDGGSSDRTRAAAEESGARVLVTAASRGLQMAEGARVTRGDWILFLHADTRLSSQACSFVRRLGPTVVGGAFRLRFDSPRLVYRALELVVRVRTRGLRLPYGDQAMFCRRTAYAAAGGMPAFPVMEDVAFIRALGRTGALSFPAIDAVTSPRRHEKRGPIRSSLWNLWLLTRYFAGVDVSELARAYRS